MVWAPFGFLTARELVSKSGDGVSFKKSERRNVNAMNCEQTWSPNLPKRKLVTVVRLSSSFKTLNRMNTRRCPSVLNAKEKSRRFAGASINLSGRHANYLHGAKVQNNAVCHLKYLQSLVFFVEEIQKSILSPNMCPNTIRLTRPWTSTCSVALAKRNPALGTNSSF